MAGFPTLTDLLNTLSFLGEEPAAVGTLITASLLIILVDWRWSLLALAVQYVLAGWLLTDVLEPQIAAVKTMVGLMTCLVLYLTARQVQWGRPRPPGPSEGNGAGTGQTKDEPKDDPASTKKELGVLPTSVMFRVLIVVPTAIVILYTTSQGIIALPQLASYINLAAVSMIAMGLVALGLTDEPLTAGMGLLTALTGFELFYLSLEQAITVIAFLFAIDFLVAIIIAYLTIAHHMTRDEAGNRGRI